MSKTEEFYTWKNKLETLGILSKLAREYYDDKSVYTAEMHDTQYKAAILTNTELMNKVSSVRKPADDKELTVDVQKDELVKAVRKIASLSNDNPEQITIKQVDDYIWDNPTYTIGTDLTTHEDEITADTASFYTTFSKSQQIKSEVEQALENNVSVGSLKFPVKSILDESFPIRDTHFNTLDQILKNIRSFDRSIGLTTLTLLDGSDDYYFVLSKRGRSVASWPEYYSLLPAGFLQPSMVKSDSLLKEQFVKNYAQEIYSIQNPTGKTPQVKGILQLFDSDEAVFEQTGFGIDALHLTPQVTAVTIIEYDEYIQYLSEKHNVNFESDKFKLIPLSESESVINELVSEKLLTPPSTFALLNGLQYIDSEYDGIESPINITIKQQ